MRRGAGLDRQREVPKGALAGLRVEGRGGRAPFLLLPVTGKRHRVSLVGISWVRGTEGSERERAQVRPKFQYPG